MIEHDKNIRDEYEFAEGATLDVLSIVAIPNDQYRPHHAFNQTFLRHVLEHGLNKAVEIRMNPEEPSDDMILGSVHHAYLSQIPGEIAKYERAPKVDRRTKEGKAVWQALVESAGPNVTLVKEDLWDKAMLLADKAIEVRRDVLGIADIHDGPVGQNTEVCLLADVRIQKEGKHYDFKLKGQLDLVWYKKLGDPVLVVDYKTSSSCAEIPVARKSRDSMWALQAYTYCTLAAAYYKAPASAYYIVSSKENDNARAYAFSQDRMIEGRNMLIRAAYRAVTQFDSDAKHQGITLL